MAESHILLAEAAVSSGSSGVGVTSAQVPAGEAGNAFPPFDTQYWAPQIFWLIILFGVLYLGMSKLALPRIASILDERRKTLDGDLAGADAARRKAEEEASAYEKSLADARARAQGEVQSQQAQLAAKSEAERKKLEAQLNEKLAAADSQIAETKAKAMANVSVIARETATAIAEKLLGRTIDQGVVDRVLSETSKS